MAVESATVDSALQVLADLGLPREQQNERSALCLLALLKLTPKLGWADAESHLIGITPMMNWARDHYGKHYAPNTRETFRRQTMHQFVDAGLALYNPDKLDRPVNSPKAVYQIEPSALGLLRTYGQAGWSRRLAAYLSTRETLAAKYANRRKLHMVPLAIPAQGTIMLSPGDHSGLIRRIVEDFGPRFAPGSDVVYVGDTGDKVGYFDAAKLMSLGVEVDQHGKLPDAVLYYGDMDWLILAEAVTSHGPVDGKRHGELKALFSSAKCGLVYVTAFQDRATMARYLPSIAWETEVWCADAPDHLIHLDGKRFLGPY